MKTLKHYRDSIVGLFLVLVGGFFYHQAAGFSSQAAVFPKIILAVFIALAFLMFVVNLKKPVEHENTVLKYPMAIYGIILVYTVLLNLVGFYIATAIFIPGTMLFYKNFKVHKIALATIGTIVFIHLLFVMKLKLMLP